jgi:hypothetical protein
VNPADRLQLDFSLPQLPYAREIVRYAWVVFSQNLALLALLTGVVILPLTYATTYLWKALGLDADTTPSLITGVVIALFSLAVQSLMFPVTTHSILGKMRDGENPPLRESFEFGISLWARTIRIRFVTALGIAAATVLFIIPGVLLWYRWIFTEVIVAVEERTEFRDVLRRSAELSDGYRVDMFVAILLASIPFAIAGWVDDHFLHTIKAGSIGPIVNGVEYLAEQYFFCLVLACYLDRRRHEIPVKSVGAGA